MQHWVPFQGRRPEQETAGRGSPGCRLEGGGCSIQLSKDYIGIPGVSNSCRTGQRTEPLVLTSPTLTLREQVGEPAQHPRQIPNHWPLCPEDAPSALAAAGLASCMQAPLLRALAPLCPSVPLCSWPLHDVEVVSSVLI